MIDRVVICPIGECECDGGGDSLLTSADREYIASMSSPKRRREISAWRTLLRSTLRELGREAEVARAILYNEVGAPYLVGSDLRFSISHSSTHVAVVISERPCAVDIELSSRDFETAASRFATAEEIALFEGSARESALAVIWSSKETLYKLSGVSGVDMIADIELLRREGSEVHGRVGATLYTIEYRFESGHVVAVGRA